MGVRVLCYLDEIYTAFITGRWGDHCVTQTRVIKLSSTISLFEYQSLFAGRSEHVFKLGPIRLYKQYFVNYHVERCACPKKHG